MFCMACCLIIVSKIDRQRPGLPIKLISFIGVAIIQKATGLTLRKARWHRHDLWDLNKLKIAGNANHDRLSPTCKHHLAIPPSDRTLEKVTWRA